MCDSSSCLDSTSSSDDSSSSDCKKYRRKIISRGRKGQRKIMSNFEQIGCYGCNPAAASTALTITPVAGGPVAVSAHLVIVQIA